MADTERRDVPESRIARLLNRAFGVAVGAGLGFSHNYLLAVRGRKTGMTFTTPVNLLDYDGRRFLVASRGETQWVRNARAAGRVALSKGSRRLEFQVREPAPQLKPPVLKAFLDRFATSVQRFYPIPKGSPVESFEAIANRYPVFELIPVAKSEARKR
ncbi:MAG: nitroreductase/quinone reductase family protein [Candidatus Binataceae bacterium]